MLMQFIQLLKQPIIFVFLVGYVSVAFSDYSGKLFDSKGRPLAGAEILLAKSHFKTVSGVDGSFKLSISSIQPSISRKTSHDFLIRGNTLSFQLATQEIVRIEMFNFQGRKLKTGISKQLTAGSYRYPLFTGVSNSVLILRISFGNAPYIFQKLHKFNGSVSASDKIADVYSPEHITKANVDTYDTMLITLDGYAPKSIPLTDSIQVDSLFLNCYSYSSKFYTGSYRISNDSLIFVKRSLDTLTTHCVYWGYIGAPPDYLAREIAPVDTTINKYWVDNDTLNLVLGTDSCMQHKAFSEDSLQPCLDTAPVRVDRILSFIRVLPGNGINGFWRQDHFSYRVVIGILDSIKHEEYEQSTANDNAYINTWKESNKLFIFENQNYYERVLAKYDFADGAIKDWRSCQSTIPLNSNTVIQADSCQYDISMSRVDSLTILLIGNISHDSVLISRLPNNDLHFKGSNILFNPAIMKENPDSCPDTIGWYLQFKASNMR